MNSIYRPSIFLLVFCSPAAIFSTTTTKSKQLKLFLMARGKLLLNTKRAGISGTEHDVWLRSEATPTWFTLWDQRSTGELWVPTGPHQGLLRIQPGPSLFPAASAQSGKSEAPNSQYGSSTALVPAGDKSRVQGSRVLSPSMALLKGNLYLCNCFYNSRTGLEVHRVLWAHQHLLEFLPSPQTPKLLKVTVVE